MESIFIYSFLQIVFYEILISGKYEKQSEKKSFKEKSNMIRIVIFIQDLATQTLTK